MSYSSWTSATTSTAIPDVVIYYGCDMANPSYIACSTAHYYGGESNIVYIHAGNTTPVYFDSFSIDPWDTDILGNSYWWSPGGMSFNAQHYNEMQMKIKAAWGLWCRNEDHLNNMQKKIEREWSRYLNNEKARERQLAQNAAEVKAQRLLGLMIGKKELEVYKRTGRIFVKGENGTYIVRKGSFTQKIEDSKIVDLCVHIKSECKCPKTDNVIALKVLLENDEKHVLKLANRIGSSSLPKELPLAACM